MISSPIYRRDSQGHIRSWSYEIDGNRYRTHAGRNAGAIISSGWVSCTAKSMLTDTEQAQFEATALERRHLSGQYSRSLDALDKPAPFMPMLAKIYSGAPSFPAISQPKLDGIRCIATAKGLFTRYGNSISSSPHIAAALAFFFDVHPLAVLDGELYNHDLKDNFNQIAAIVRRQNCSAEDLATSAAQIQLHIYDCYHPSADWHTRMQITRALSADARTLTASPIRFVETTQVADLDGLDACYAEYLASGYEGQMVRLQGPYEQKRSALLLKRKQHQDAEFTIVDIREGKGGAAGSAKKLVCRLPDGREFGAGIRGGRNFGAKLLQDANLFIGKQATIQFFGYTPAGIPRFPVATKFDRYHW